MSQGKVGVRSSQGVTFLTLLPPLSPLLIQELLGLREGEAGGRAEVQDLTSTFSPGHTRPAQITCPGQGSAMGARVI